VRKAPCAFLPLALGEPPEANSEDALLKKKSEKQNEQADLGFGSVVAGESRQRLVNKDGTFNVIRKGLNFFTSLSLYHSLVSMSWWRFILAAWKKKRATGSAAFTN
jgi:hypothetical protein